jgi:Fuc2NAc and GlcNAc transferase
LRVDIDRGQHLILQSVVLGTVAVVLSALLTAWVRRTALARGILDSPNERSSHVLPTPRGGGIAIVVVSLAGVSVCAAMGYVDARLFYALVAGGASVALVGYLDDRGRIGIAGRFTVHIAAAIWAVAWVGWPTTVRLGEEVLQVGAVSAVVSVLGIVWALNLFNFMDGIDGIAASQAVFMAGAGALLACMAGLTSGVPFAGVAIAAASLGFLCWNWPPARIFMGDVGSGYLGYVLAVLTLWAVRESAYMLPVWLVLSGVFVVDATLTLMRRLARRERVYEAHRSHAYQWLSRRWNSHRRVTAACIALNGLWLAPWAWACTRYPGKAWWFVIVAWAPLILLAAISGAGRKETAASRAG